MQLKVISNMHPPQVIRFGDPWLLELLNVLVFQCHIMLCIICLYVHCHTSNGLITLGSGIPQLLQLCWSSPQEYRPEVWDHSSE